MFLTAFFEVSFPDLLILRASSSENLFVLGARQTRVIEAKFAIVVIKDSMIRRTHLAPRRR